MGRALGPAAQRVGASLKARAPGERLHELDATPAKHLPLNSSSSHAAAPASGAPWEHGRIAHVSPPRPNRRGRRARRARRARRRGPARTWYDATYFPLDREYELWFRLRDYNVTDEWFAPARRAQRPPGPPPRAALRDRGRRAGRDPREYWVFNGLDGAIDRYYFYEPHVLGGDDHSDGVTLRYAPGALRRVSGVPGHLALDVASGSLSICDTGNARVARLDTTQQRAAACQPRAPPASRRPRALVYNCGPRPRGRSSTGQSSGFLIRRLGVRVPPPLPAQRSTRGPCRATGR